MEIDVLILGAGAAGLYCAIHAAARGRRVILLEQNADIGQKIRVSGGGRCNLTNLDIRADAYLSHNPHFCRSALSRHSQHDALAWFAGEGLDFAEKTQGQLFCMQRSRGVIDALRAACARHGVIIRTETRLEHLSRDNNGTFHAQSTQGPFRAPQFVIASGGASFPKLGGSDIALRLARQFGLKSYPFRPALVPLTLAQPWPQLAGASCTVAAHTGDSPVFRDQLLFTIAASPARPFCKSPPTGTKNKPSCLIFSPTPKRTNCSAANTQRPSACSTNTCNKPCHPP